MNTFLPPRLIAIACALLAAQANASPVSLYDNLSSDANASYFNFDTTHPGWAQGFTVADPYNQVTQLQFNLFKGGTSTGVFYVRILGTGTNGLPDFSQEKYFQQLTDADIPIGRPNYVTLNLLTSATLSPNGTYWLAVNIADANPGFNYGWALGPGTNFQVAEYDTGLGPWVYVGGTSPFTSASFGANVIAVPEPSAAILGGGAAAVAGCWTLRRRKASGSMWLSHESTAVGCGINNSPFHRPRTFSAQDRPCA